VVKHPVSTVQPVFHGVSGTVFVEIMENQVLVYGAEVRLVRAYDDLFDANSKRDETKSANNLKKFIQDSFVRWTLDRHMLMVRRVTPHTTSWPKLSDSKTKSDKGRKRNQWVDYGHHLLRHHLEHYGYQYIDRNPNLSMPSEEALDTSVERLVVTSTPYQMLLMKISATTIG
ncbi:MAG: hypothetical protein Q9192_008997, partial [Flavoplaca navasiana]